MTVSASLEIHVINVSQGDSILIINRDLAKVKKAIEKVPGTTVPGKRIDWVPYAIEQKVPLTGTVKKALLVDGGYGWFGRDVLFKLRRHGVVEGKAGWCPNLYVMVSHFHDDHQMGLRDVLLRKVPGKTKKGKQQFVTRYVPGRIYLSPLADARNPGNTSFPLFKKAVRAVARAHPTQKTTVVEVGRGGVPAGRKDFTDPVGFDLGTGVVDDDGTPIPITVRMIAAGQSVHLEQARRLEPVPSKTSGKSVDENDRSLVFVLEYGSFRFFCGGDIAGDGMAFGGNPPDQSMPPIAKAVQAKKKKKAYGSKKKRRPKLGVSYTHADVETPLRTAMVQAYPELGWVAGEDWSPNAGHCTVMKASHHGSASSVDTYFLATLRPTVVAISSGIKLSNHGHPTDVVLRRLHRSVAAQWEDPFSTATPKEKVDNTVEQVYITEMTKLAKGVANPAKPLESRLIGDITIRPVDETIVAVRAASATAPAKLQVQVYGTGDVTRLVGDAGVKLPGYELMPGEPVDGMATAYRVGPWYHPDKV
ncbi:hypothetical protein [Herbidospora sp. NBRC 101105]|uniref:ComEC/Rec2 family competence protein n=1 Tax=Herbidospora sp. NBRC 101105 TaxID=3032195 RepID=UPI0025541708|nr:hypothetical protein [Herbidospora sp. NBRC 101105]